MDAVHASIEIPATPEQVWEVIMDPNRLGDWVTIHRKLGPSDDPLGPGKKVQQVLCLRGVHFKVRWTVNEYDPPHHAMWEGKGPARSRARTVYDLHAADGGTRFDYVNEFKPPMGPLGSVAGQVLVGGLSQREADASLRQLRAIFEKS